MGWRAAQEGGGGAGEPPGFLTFCALTRQWPTFADGCEDDFLKTSYFVTLPGVNDVIRLEINIASNELCKLVMKQCMLFLSAKSMDKI